MRLAAAALAALALAPAAGAWTRLGAAPKTEQASMLVTQSGTELAAWSDQASTLTIWSPTKGTKTFTVPFVAQPRLVQQPNGTLQLYAGSGTGVRRYTSTDDGGSWTGPIQTLAIKTGPVESAAVRPDGTPMFAQDSTAGIDVYQGLNGELGHRVFSACCGYAESLAVDSSNYAQIAFWSNATAFPNLYVYEGLDAGGGQAGPGRAFGQPQTISRATGDNVPLVADRLGDTFMGWANGYPASTTFVVNTFQGGNLLRSKIVVGSPFHGGDPHMALAVEPSNRLWAVLTQEGAARVRRSRSSGAHFGQFVTLAFPVGKDVAYGISADARNGILDAIVNLGDGLYRQTFLPGLAFSFGHRTVAVVDDGFAVPGAIIRAGSVSVHTDSHGKASLLRFKHHVLTHVTAPGYTPTGFRVP